MKKLITIGAFLWLCMGCEAILVKDISNAQVITLAPTEGVQVAVGTISLRWEVVDEATSYRVQVATPNFDNATQVLLDSSVHTNTIDVTLASGTYQWRVSASNSDYSTEYTTINFTVN